MKNQNQLIKSAFIELATIGAKAGFSKMPLSLIVVDLVTGALKLSNENEVREYLKLLKVKIEKLEIEVEALQGNLSYQNFNEKKLIDLKPYYSKLDLEIEAQIAIGISQIDLNLPINQFVYDASLNTSPLVLKVLWLVKQIQDLKEDEIKWDNLNKVGDKECDRYDRQCALLGNYIKLVFKKSFGADIPSKLQALGLIEKTNYFSSGVCEDMLSFSELSSTGMQLVKLILPIGEKIDEYFINEAGMNLKELREKMIVDFKFSKITFNLT